VGHVARHDAQHGRRRLQGLREASSRSPASAIGGGAGQEPAAALGYSHDVASRSRPASRSRRRSRPRSSITGIDKQQVGQVAAEIRESRPPEPYKGKGVKYAGEFIFRKEGKKK
jgi:hypothetical protein